MLDVRNLSAGYRGRRVLEDATFSVGRGELCALLGENGSGKSTLLRAVGGLLACSAARCAVDGRELHALSARERARLAAYLPQRCHVDAGASALDAVLMGANARTPLLGGYTRAQRERASERLARVGLAGCEGALCGTLSEGQRHLTALARTLMQQPRLYLLDEPDGGLDLTRRYEALRVLRGVLAQEGACALAALHDAQLALTACDRVLILREGRIACELDMRSAQESQVQSAMRLLYGGVSVRRVGAVWTVLPEEDPLHP